MFFASNLPHAHERGVFMEHDSARSSAPADGFQV